MPNADEIAVGQLFDEYEAALIRNDIDAMNAAFVDSSDTVRFGIADLQFGFDEVVAWRKNAQPVSPQRRITRRIVQSLGADVVAVDITFVDGDSPMVGRQSQIWVHGASGWRIARAHVSVIPA